MQFSELLRENKRMLDKSIREIERERQALQAQEKKLIVEIKKSAKQGQMVCFVRLIIQYTHMIYDVFVKGHCTVYVILKV